MNEESNAKAWSELHLMRQRLASLEQRHSDEIATLKARLADLESELSPVTAAPGAPKKPVVPVTAAAPAPARPVFPAMVTAKPEQPPVTVSKPVDRAPLELRLGRVWLVRIGIALLLTGFVLLGNFAYKNWIRELPPGVRLAALYFSSLLLSGTGLHFGKREDLKRFGEVLLAGGMAFFYWCTFASHHVARLQVVESPVLAGALLLGVAGGIVAIALRRDSRAVAVMGLLFASYAIILQPLGWLSAASNLVLAIAGMSLMTRREWGAPGIVAMAGIYLSFLWWQIAGAAGMRSQDTASLYFLPPIWMAFALPGVTGAARYFPGLSARVRAWFLTINNGAFFALFSWMWVEQRGSEHYWAVPAVFGSVLLSMGVLGRRSDRASGDSQLAQGLATLTLAMTLKLEGNALALGFAVQALLTGLAFARSGGRIEMIASPLAALAGAIWLIFAGGMGHEIPDWNRGLVAAVIMGSVLPLYHGWQRHGITWNSGQPARAATLVALAAGSIATLLGWCLHLDEGPRYLSLLGIGTAMTAGALILDRKRQLPELGNWSMAFHAAGLLFLLKSHPIFSWTRETVMLAWWWPATALLMGLAGHWLWVHRAPTKSKGLTFADLSAGVTALIAFVSIHSLIAPLDLAAPGRMVVSGMAALALAATGRFLLATPMLIAGAVLFLGEIILVQVGPAPIPWPAEFIPLLVAGGIAFIAYDPYRNAIRSVAGAAARVCAVVSWVMAWFDLAPDTWADIVAASALVLLTVPLRAGRGRMPEPWALLGVSLIWLAIRMAVVPWQLMDSPPAADGWMVVAALLAAPFVAKLPWQELRPARQVLIFAGCSLLAAWCTQTMVWHFGWKPVAIGWTVLGFTMVSAGLWRKLATMRHVGFALLGIAVIKLFAVDVWDFATFFRVTAFLSLGVALVVLGFFYNRFADVLKKLLEADRA